MHKLHFFECLIIFHWELTSYILEPGNKKAHAGVCHQIKENSIKIHIPGQDGDFRQCTGCLTFSLSITAHIIHKSQIQNCQL